MTDQIKTDVDFMDALGELVEQALDEVSPQGVSFALAETLGRVISLIKSNPDLPLGREGTLRYCVDDIRDVIDEASVS